MFVWTPCHKRVELDKENFEVGGINEYCENCKEYMICKWTIDG